MACLKKLLTALYGAFFYARGFRAVITDRKYHHV